MTRMNGQDRQGYVIDHVAVEFEARRLRNEAIRDGLIAIRDELRRRFHSFGRRTARAH
ncbi:RSP_7527 family protein [Rhodobacter sp. NSM]|uniref:RSP_7527 family protein n=1 Tax=Rhodobacter sp. NSM TaxID=3457501 RepID=UPI003FD2DA37